MSSLKGLKVGDSVDQFDILERLGEGGMGEVYLAQDNQLKRKVALKLVVPERAEETELIERFLVEARTLATLDHSHIVRVYSIGRFGRGHYLVIEYVEGKSLSEILKARNLGVKESVLYLRQICDGLMMCHENGIIHRDIKPHNLLVRSDGVVKIVDFGIAKDIGGSAKNLNLTQDNMIIGTPLYLSPEVVTGAAPSNQSDIFSLGVTFFYMLTGRLPFTAKNQLELLEKIRNQEAEFTEDELERIPSVFVKITQRMLEKNLADRYKNFKEVIADIDSLPISELEDDRPMVVDKKYNVVNEPAIQLKLLQKGLTRQEVQLVVNEAAEAVIQIQRNGGEDFDPDSTVPLARPDEDENIGPVNIPNQLLDEKVEEFLKAKADSKSSGSKKTGTKFPFLKKSKSDIFATKTKADVEKSGGKKTIAEEIAEEERTRTAKTAPNPLPFHKIVFWVMFLISGSLLATYFYMPFEHPNLLKVLGFSYLAFAVSTAGIFSNPILRTSIPVIMINIVFVSWIMPDRPIKDVNKFKRVLIENLKSYEGYSTDSSQFFHLTDQGVFKRSLAKTYFDLGLKEGNPSFFKRGFFALVDNSFFVDVVNEESNEVSIIGKRTSLGRLLGNKTLVPGDFIVSGDQRRLAIFIEGINWMVEDPDAKVMKIMKAPLMSQRPIYSMSASLARFGQKSDRVQKTNQSKFIQLADGTKIDVSGKSQEEIDKIIKKYSKIKSKTGSVKSIKVPNISVDGRKPAKK